MHKIVRLFAVAGMLAMGAVAAQASSDPDLPPVPVPGDPAGGPPCNGTVCLHNWSNALAVFFEQKQCLKADGTVLEGVSPFDMDPDCKSLGYLSPGEILPYHKTDEDGNWSDNIPVQLPPPNGTIAVGLQCYKPTCGSNPGAPEDVMNTAGDVFTQRPFVGHVVAHAKTTDNSGTTVHVTEDCAGGTITAASLYDTHVFLDDTATQPGIVSGNSQTYGQIFARIQDPNCPQKGNDYFLRNEQWFFALHQFPLGAGKVDNPPMSASLLTLVHTSIFPQPDDCKLEQEYFTREMGKVRHEAYYNQDCGDPGGYYEQLHEILLANPGDCNPASLEPPPQNWKEYGCGATIRSAPPIGNGNPDDDPQKAVDILTASNWTSVLFGVVTPSDNPTVDSISQPTIGYGDSNTSLTLRDRSRSTSGSLTTSRCRSPATGSIRSPNLAWSRRETRRWISRSPRRIGTTGPFNAETPLMCESPMA